MTLNHHPTGRHAGHAFEHGAFRRIALAVAAGFTIVCLLAGLL